MGRAVGGAMDFRDIASVQILRGPQGTLFGRNTIGGAVLLTTNPPGEDAGNSVRLGVGEDNLFEAFGAFDLPLGDTWAARVALGGRQRDGYVKRAFDGEDLGDEKMYTGQLALRWKPSDSFAHDAARRLHEGRRERLAVRVPVDERGRDLRRCREHRRRLSRTSSIRSRRRCSSVRSMIPVAATMRRRSGIHQRWHVSRFQHARESAACRWCALGRERCAGVQVDHRGPAAWNGPARATPTTRRC